MAKSTFAITSIVAGLAAAVAIGAAPSAAAAPTAPTPVNTDSTTAVAPAGGDGGGQAIQKATVPSGSSAAGSLALPPGGAIAVLPQDQATGGADPYLPFGSDPYVPNGVWAP
jgi:hypothetical protein